MGVKTAHGVYVVTMMGSPIAWFVAVNGNVKSAQEMAESFILEHLPTKHDDVLYIPGMVTIPDFGM